MFRYQPMILGIGLACSAFLSAGCDSGKIKTETIEVKDQDPLKQAIKMLENYAKGQPVTSEVTSYDYLVESVKKVDPTKGEILKKGLEDLKKNPTNPGPRAKKLLKDLGN